MPWYFDRMQFEGQLREVIQKENQSFLNSILFSQSEHMKNAQQYFHLVGSSASECDTIPGRQSMASAFFLYEQFEEVLVYLNSIRSFFVSDDVFNYNYAQVCHGPITHAQYI